MANKFSKSVAVTTSVLTQITDPETGLVVAAASKKQFARTQPSTSAYLEAVAATDPLTMLTADETRQLARAGEKETATDEDLIFKYRQEFLHIQKVAENGISTLGVIVADPEEFKQVAVNWGFTAQVESLYKTDVVVGKNLARTEVKTLTSNVTVDWSKPKKPKIDVAYYRQSGNIVNTAVAKTGPVDLVKAQLQLGVYPTTAQVETAYVRADQYQTFAINSSNYRYIGSGTGAVFSILASALSGGGQRYQFGRAGSAGGGQNYAQGELILVPGTSLGGTSPLNDASITILNVNTTGAIVSATLTGTTSDRFISLTPGEL